VNTEKLFKLLEQGLRENVLPHHHLDSLLASLNDEELKELQQHVIFALNRKSRKLDELLGVSKL
jgi:hypothetical protein